MTSDAKIRANRRNARRSSGPKTAIGKAISRRNARKHGLAVPLDMDDPEISELANVMAELGHMFGQARELARVAARDQCEVTRVRRARTDMLNEKIRTMSDSEDQSVTADQRIASVTALLLPNLEALDRYERRALSSLRKKICKLQGE